MMYNDQFVMLLAVFERAALLLMVLFWLTRLHLIQTIVQKTDRRPAETTLLAALFIGFALFSTYTGVNVDGSLVNVRIIAIVAGGILFGPWVGVSAGVVSGLHRYLIDIDGPTSQACLIASIVAGLLSALIHYRADKAHYARYGILVGMACEALTMGLIVLLAEDNQLAYSIVSHISFPMIAGTLSIGLIIQLVQHLDDEKERLAAQQAKQALHIATQTLPYFRQGGRAALTKGCQVILQNTQADAVAITDTQDVLAYVGIGEEEYFDAHHQISELTQQAVKLGQQIISNNLNLHNFRSLLIIPLWENQQVAGTLKIFYRQPNRIRRPLKEMAIGLSQLISTQLEVSRVEQLKEMASQAEFSALQSKINPHFLFNALNAISSLIRLRPDEARSLIGNLADFLRYNLQRTQILIPLDDALKQVRDYVAIEQARFGRKLQVHFDVEPVAISIAPLLIQPLVENAIQHGFQPSAHTCQVTIKVRKTAQGAQITITDTGVGIAPELIDKLNQGDIDSQHIGLMNVHQRLHLLYGQGLHIERLNPGTQIRFDILTKGKACYAQ